jgi:hypothetical protein
VDTPVCQEGKAHGVAKHAEHKIFAFLPKLDKIVIAELR